MEYIDCNGKRKRMTEKEYDYHVRATLAYRKKMNNKKKT